MNDHERLDWLSYRMGEADLTLWRELGLDTDCMTLRDAIDKAAEAEGYRATRPAS